MPLEWSERILDYPVRTAAVDTFLQELRSKRAADLNGVLVTLNDGSLCREALRHWLLNEWIVVAPHSPLTALPGPAFRREISLREFCGRPPASPLEPPPFEQPDGAEEEKAKAEEGSFDDP